MDKIISLLQIDKALSSVVVNNSTFEPLCGADFDSMPSTCDVDGNRKVDKLGLAFIFTGILLTGKVIERSSLKKKAKGVIF